MAEEKKEEKGKAEKAELTPEEATAKAKKKRLILFGAIGGILVVGIGVGLFLFLSGGSKKEEGGEAVSAEEHAPAEGEKPAEEPKKEEQAAKDGAKEAEGAKDGKDEKTAKEGEAAKDEKKEASALNPEVAADFGETLALKTFHLNLGNPLENNYVRIEVSLEYTGGEEQKAEIERRMPQIRDAVVSIVSRKTREFLLSPDGKHQLRKEIFTRINRYMTKPIKSVFITDLLIE